MARPDGAEAGIRLRENWSAISGARARAEAGVPLDEFTRVARDLNARRVIGRFSTFLEHVKPT